MLLYNMHKLNFISNEYYNEVLERYKESQKKPVVQKEGKRGGFGAKADQRVFSERGQKFVSLVANNMEKGLITHSDALSFLSTKLKNLDKIVSKAKK